LAKDYCQESNNGSKKTREKALPRLNQCRIAVKLAATIKPSTIIVVVNENLRSVFINSSPFNPHMKSELAHFYTVLLKNLPGFRLITVFALPLFIKIGQNSTLNL
jgi:hypothetical protein